MKRRFAIVLLTFALSAGVSLLAQEVEPFSSPRPKPPPTDETTATPPPSVKTSAPTPSAAAVQQQPAVMPAPPEAPPQPTPQKHGWSIFHPFGGSSKPRETDYQNAKLRGLVLQLELTPQPVKLSEVRQLNVHVILTNKSKKAVTLDFPNDQRIDIQLLNAAEAVLTRWSDTHAVKDKPGTLLINPGEHVEYRETIATRELSPDKVYTLEVFFPKYPELRVRQKFLPSP